MKKMISSILIIVLIISTLCGCTKKVESSVYLSEGEVGAGIVSAVDEDNNLENIVEINADDEEEVSIIDVSLDTEYVEDFVSLDDPNLLQYVEDTVYAGLEEQFASEDYVIDDVSAIYISNEYLEELAYNSKANIWFGYSLEDIETQFQGESYVFTLDDDGTTTVIPFENYEDIYAKVIENVAIGTGVILVCVTVSVASYGAGAMPVSMIFAASAESAATMALSSGIFSAVFTGTVTGIQTSDFDEAIEAALLHGSEGFKWGAIAGTLVGGVSKGVELVDDARRIEAIELAMEGAEEWRQAELRALIEYGGEEQLSYLGGEIVERFTPGATRPDVIRYVGDHLEAIEVKYYNLESQASLNTLYRELEREVSSRLVNLPAGSTQRIVLDVTGRGFSEATTEAVKNTIVERLFDIYPNIPVDIVGL